MGLTVSHEDVDVFKPPAIGRPDPVWRHFGSLDQHRFKSLLYGIEHAKPAKRQNRRERPTYRVRRIHQEPRGGSFKEIELSRLSLAKPARV